MNLIGQTLGSYRILSELGHGGMGTVYRGVHVTRGYPVALKVLSPQLAQSPDFARRFLREMEAMRRLNHRHIVRLYQAGQAQGMLYMAMELMQGGSLDRRLAEGPLELPTAVAILVQIAAALDHAHRHGVIHRDVKPSNILFAHDGRAVLSDFGLASVAGQSRLTMTGVAVGTPEYSSPEQAQGRNQPDHRTDVYSLGVIAYQMLAGHVPFERDNTWATLLAHIREAPPPLQHWNRTVSPAVQTVILQALEKTPERRYASAGQFAQALVAAAGGAAVLENLGMQHPRTPTPQPGSGMQFNAKSIWLVIVLSVVVIGTIILLSAPPVPLPAPANLPPARGPLIAFESDQNGNKEIYVADPTGRSRWRLTDHPAMDWGPAWSPDGQRLAFVSDRSGFMDIYIMNRQGREVLNLTHSPALDSGPAWSPDGQRIAFDTDRDGNLEIYVMNLDGTGMTNLSQHPASDGDPSWSPDGRWITFESDRDGDFEVYVLPVAGGETKRLTVSSGRDFAPVWSPDGQRIVFECQRDGPEICVMNADGGQVRRLTTDRVVDQQPGWSPDGRQIIWTRQQPLTGIWDLYVMDANGQNVHSLLASVWSETAPVWTAR